MESMKRGDVGLKRKMIKEMIDGCWESCFYPDPLTGELFVANAIIANPPSFARVHCAEALGIPVGTVRSRLHRARSELRDLLTTAGLVDDIIPPPEPSPVRVGPAGDPSASSIYPGKARGRRSPWPSSPESP